MKIAILSPERSHTLDLARELHGLGHEVHFYSYVPKFRSRLFGLPDECARSGFIWVAPLYVLNKIFHSTAFGEKLGLFQRIWWDLIVSLMLEPCDVVIAMSGSFDRSLAKAKKRWDAAILIERGSRHILSQKQILDAVKALHPEADTVPDPDVRWELRDYARADRIVVASRHVVQSFVEQGVGEEKLFRNPYGVDLSMFPPTIMPVGHPTVLMVGTWSYRKGSDLLEAAIRGLEYRLLHAGSIGDCSFPKDPQFQSLGIVDQTNLKSVYAQAHLMVLPSREEGLARVQAQALSCGLGLVCSDRTGGADLGEMLDDPGLVTVVRSDDVQELRSGIQRAMKSALQRGGLRVLSENSLEKMSWKAYGLRYDAFLRQLIPQGRT